MAKAKHKQEPSHVQKEICISTRPKPYPTNKKISFITMVSHPNWSKSIAGWNSKRNQGKTSSSIELYSGLNWTSTYWAILKRSPTLTTCLHQQHDSVKSQQRLISSKHQACLMGGEKKGTWCPQPKAMSFGLVRQMGQTCTMMENIHSREHAQFICKTSNRRSKEIEKCSIIKQMWVYGLPDCHR